MILGVAKGTTRKPGMETLILADQNNRIIGRPAEAALHLIQQIRDEAHRFGNANLTLTAIYQQNIRQLALTFHQPGIATANSLLHGGIIITTGNAFNIKASIVAF